ncbi:MAG: hypothetical protein QW835_00615 [Candidatus Hadarchaeum sp.]
MSGYNLPDNISAWNQEEKLTRIIIRVHYASQVRDFETIWDWCPSEEEVFQNFDENYYITVEYPEPDR